MAKAASTLLKSGEWQRVVLVDCFVHDVGHLSTLLRLLKDVPKNRAFLPAECFPQSSDFPPDRAQPPQSGVLECGGCSFGQPVMQSEAQVLL